MQNTDLQSRMPRPLGLRKNQLTVFESPARFRVVVAGRRFGKSQLAWSK